MPINEVYFVSKHVKNSNQQVEESEYWKVIDSTALQALKRDVPSDEELNGGSHLRMSDEVEETSDILLVEYEVVCGV